MPQIHLGVYLTSGNETVNAVKWALEVKTKTVPSLERQGSANDTFRLGIERNGGKISIQECHVTDTSQHRFSPDVP